MFRAGNQWFCPREDITTTQFQDAGWVCLVVSGDEGSSSKQGCIWTELSFCVYRSADKDPQKLEDDIKKMLCSMWLGGQKGKKSPVSLGFCTRHPGLSTLSALGSCSSISHSRLTVGIPSTFWLQDQILQLNSVFICSGKLKCQCQSVRALGSLDPGTMPACPWVRICSLCALLQFVCPTHCLCPWWGCGNTYFPSHADTWDLVALLQKIIAAERYCSSIGVVSWLDATAWEGIVLPLSKWRK